MIKVGDKFIFEEDEWTVIDVTGCDDTLIARTKDGEDNVFFQSTVYKLWYEQQKQSADRAEKRWDDLETKIENLIDESYENHKDDSVQIFSYVLELMKEINEERGLVD